MAYGFCEIDSITLSNHKGLGIQSNEDWYLVHAEFDELQEVGIKLNTDISVGNIDINVFDESGDNLLFQSRVDTQDKLFRGFEELVQFYTRKAGNYLVQIVGDNAGNSYDIFWRNSKEISGDDFYDYSDNNNTIHTAYTSLYIFPRREQCFSLANYFGTGIQNDDDWYEPRVDVSKP